MTDHTSEGRNDGPGRSSGGDSSSSFSEFATSSEEKAKEKVESFADRGKSLGADKLEGLSATATRVADSLDDDAPQIARYIRRTADEAHAFSETLRERSIGDLAGDVGSFAKRQPLIFFGAAMLGGFALARLLKAGGESVHSTKSGLERPYAPSPDAEAKADPEPAFQAPGEQSDPEDFTREAVESTEHRRSPINPDLPSAF